jgi:hypothetical protein
VDPLTAKHYRTAMSPNTLDAANRVVETIVGMAGEQRPLMARVLPVGDVHFWAHYPDDDARDEASQSRWYYHVHAPGDRDPAEHGHFHLFLHLDQFGPDAQLVAMPAEGMEAPAKVSHLAGLSVDHSGVPLAWFATNRWVTDEFLYPAETVIDHLAFYDVDNTAEDRLVNRFLTAMVTLYREELSDLLRQRDAAMATFLAAEGPDAYEAGHDVLAVCPIDLDAKMESLGL